MAIPTGVSMDETLGKFIQMPFAQDAACFLRTADDLVQFEGVVIDGAG